MVEAETLAVCRRIASAGAYVTHAAVVHEIARTVAPEVLAQVNPDGVPTLRHLAQLQQCVDLFVTCFIESRHVCTILDLEAELPAVLESFMLEPLGSAMASEEIDLDECPPPADTKPSTFADYGLGPIAAHPQVRLHWRLASEPCTAQWMTATEVHQALRAWAMESLPRTTLSTTAFAEYLCRRKGVGHISHLGLVLGDMAPVLLMARHAWAREQEILARAWNASTVAEDRPGASTGRKRRRHSPLVDQEAGGPGPTTDSEVPDRVQAFLEAHACTTPPSAVGRGARVLLLRAAMSSEAALATGLSPSTNKAWLPAAADTSLVDDIVHLLEDSRSPLGLETLVTVAETLAWQRYRASRDEGNRANEARPIGLRVQGPLDVILGCSDGQGSVHRAQGRRCVGPREEQQETVHAARRTCMDGGVAAHGQPAGRGDEALTNFRVTLDKSDSGGTRWVSVEHVSACLALMSPLDPSADIRAVGRWGEALVHQLLLLQHPDATVRWVNELVETGLAYDHEVTSRKLGTVFVEVKTTRHAGKNAFPISMREWALATTLRSKFHVYRVYADVTVPSGVQVEIAEDPARLVDTGQALLCLAI